MNKKDPAPYTRGISEIEKCLEKQENIMKQTNNLGFKLDQKTSTTKYGAIPPILDNYRGIVSSDELVSFLCTNHQMNFRQVKDTSYQANFKLGCHVDEKDGTFYVHFDLEKGDIMPNQ